MKCSHVLGTVAVDVLQTCRWRCKVTETQRRTEEDKTSANWSLKLGRFYCFFHFISFIFVTKPDLRKSLLSETEIKDAAALRQSQQFENVLRTLVLFLVKMSHF